MADPCECAGQTFIGKVKSYSPSKGYGFVTADDLLGDIFFVHKNLPKEVVYMIHGSDFYLTGQEVSFTCEISDEGKPTASEIRLLADTTHKFKSKGKGKKGKGKGWGFGWEEPEAYVSGQGVLPLGGKDKKGKGKGKGKTPYW